MKKIEYITTLMGCLIYAIIITLDNMSQHKLRSKLLKACRTGNLELVKIMSNDIDDRFDIHDKYEYLIAESCHANQLEIIKYFMSLKLKYGIINIHASNNHLFKICCEKGYLEILKYLISLIKSKHAKFNNDIINGYLFRICCYFGQLEILKYLLSLQIEYGEINIRKNHDDGFISCMRYKYLKFAKYLCTLIDNYEIIDDKPIILNDEQLKLKIQKKCFDRIQLIKDELMAVSWHPDRVTDWCLDIESSQSIKLLFRHD
jgi:hypothetical protein